MEAGGWENAREKGPREAEWKGGERKHKYVRKDLEGRLIDQR